MKLLRFALHKFWGSDAAQDLVHMALLPVVVLGFVIIWFTDGCKSLIREYREFNPEMVEE